METVRSVKRFPPIDLESDSRSGLKHYTQHTGAIRFMTMIVLHRIVQTMLLADRSRPYMTDPGHSQARDAV